MLDTTQRLLVPKIDWNGRAADMRSRLVTWEWFWKPQRGKSELVIDLSKVTFMKPWALAMFTVCGCANRA
mgnify:CR=1 FL=1